MNEQTKVFFENDLELPASELLLDCENKIKRFGLSLKQNQLNYVLIGENSDIPVAFKEQQHFLLKNFEKFKEEYLVWQFSHGKSQSLVTQIFQKKFKDEPPIETNDKFLQLLMLYRCNKEELQAVQAFQKLQRRSGKNYKIICFKPSNEQEFKDFVTFDSIERVIDNMNKIQSDLFERSNTTNNQHNLLPHCKYIAQTNNSIYVFLRKPRELVFVTPSQSRVGDHRYKSTNIVLKFATHCDQLLIYSDLTIGVRLAEQIASAFYKAPVSCVIDTDCVSLEKLSTFVNLLLFQHVNEVDPYVFKIKFALPNTDGRVCLEISIDDPNNEIILGEYAVTVGFSMERLYDLKSLDVEFESQKVMLFFEYDCGHFFVFFTSKSLSYDSRERLIQWGKNFGIALLQK